MERYVIVAVILTAIIGLLIWLLMSKAKHKEESDKIINEMTEKVNKANTLENVSSVWDELMEKCTFNTKSGNRFLKIDLAYKYDYERLYTICETKYDILKERSKK